jgi:pimeloyl-ACP methyl ester carboxylesterase
MIRRSALGGVLGTLSLGAVLLAAGCGDGQPEAGPSAVNPTSTAPSSPAGPCRDAALVGKQVTFPGSGGAQLTGYVVGTGTTAVVLVPQRRMDSCSFTAYAKALAGRGYRVLAFDFAGEGGSASAPDATNSGDVKAAIAYLRQAGAGKIALIGTSRGGTAALIAASVVKPPVAGVISVSAPRVFDGEDAEAAVKTLAAPALYIAAQDDGTAADDVRKLHDATPGDQRKLLVVSGRAHGIAFLGGTDQAAAEVENAIDTFLTKYAPTG